MCKENENSAHLLDKFLPCLVKWGGMCPLPWHTVSLTHNFWFGMWVGLILNLGGWGMPKTGEGFGHIPGHQDMDFLALVILFHGKSIVLLPLPFAQAIIVLPHSV